LSRVVRVVVRVSSMDFPQAAVALVDLEPVLALR
jgi:hypothetical protein